MRERVLITGGAGFIGSHLAANHIESGDEVHIVVRPGGPSRPDRVGPGVVVHPVDLDAPSDVHACLQQVEPTLIYHLASATGRDAMLPGPEDWTGITRDLDRMIILLSAAAQCRSLRTFVRAGSLAEYGSRPDSSNEGRREQPHTIYTAAMVAGAHFAAMLQRSLDFPVLTARLALTYGPGQSETFLLPNLLRRCLAGQTCTVRSPDSRRDMVFVDDIVAGLRAMARSRLPGGTILNLGSGQAPRMRELVDVVLRVTGIPAYLVEIDRVRSSDWRIDTLCAAPERAASLLGWRASTSLEHGIARTAAAYAPVMA